MRRLGLAFLLTLLILGIGCSYTLQYKYPSPTPAKSHYKLDNIEVNIVNSEKEFQALVKSVFGEEDSECIGFTTYKNEKTIIYMLTNSKDGSINLYFLGHEIWYHHMEKEKGH